MYISVCIRVRVCVRARTYISCVVCLCLGRCGSISLHRQMSPCLREPVCVEP